MTLSRCPTPATQFARCHHLMQPWQCNSQKTRNMTHLESKVLRLPRRMNMDTSKFCMPRKMKVIFWKPCESIAPVTKNDFRHHLQTRQNVKMRHACHAKRHWTCWDTFEKERFSSPPIGISFCVAGAIFRTLYTLHSTLCTDTPHSTIYTLHFTFHTLHSALYTFYTPHFTFLTYILHFTLYNLHSTRYTPHSTLYTPHFALDTLHSTLYIPHFTLYTLHSTLYTLHFTLHSLHSTLYTVHSTLYTPRFTFFTWHFTPHTPHSTIPTSHSTHNIPHSTFHLLHTPHFALHPLPHSTVSTVHWYGNRGNMHKTLQITCFTRVFYVTAFGFVGCFLLLVFQPQLNGAFRFAAHRPSMRWRDKRKWLECAHAQGE